MPAQWTGDILSQMHLNHITAKRLAEYLGYNPKYVSAILNGKKEPKKAEERFRRAVEELCQQDAMGQA